jgi:hypothetical protein
MLCFDSAPVILVEILKNWVATVGKSGPAHFMWETTTLIIWAPPIRAKRPEHDIHWASIERPCYTGETRNTTKFIMDLFSFQAHNLFSIHLYICNFFQDINLLTAQSRPDKLTILALICLQISLRNYDHLLVVVRRVHC